MCGRYTLRDKSLEALRGRTLYDELARLAEQPPRYNVAPTQLMPVVRSREGGGFRIDLMRWGLISPMAKDPRREKIHINARAETLAELKTFKWAYRNRRCLIPVDGFYEWLEDASGKHAIYFHKADDGLFAFAGIWEEWKGPQGVIESFAIVTTEANELTRPVHHRMPVILPREAYNRWLDPRQHEPDALQPLLIPYAGDDLIATDVGSYVNSNKHDDPACITPVGGGS